MSGHTPGPWYVGAQNDMLFVIAGRAPSLDNDYPMHDADRTVIARVEDGDKSHSETDANARLIAAAPELLAALKQCAELLDDYSDVNDGADGGSPVPNRAMSLLRDVEAAIAKAEGR
jgi:hypothetical protein